MQSKQVRLKNIIKMSMQASAIKDTSQLDTLKNRAVPQANKLEEKLYIQ